MTTTTSTPATLTTDEQRVLAAIRTDAARNGGDFATVESIDAKSLGISRKALGGFLTSLQTKGVIEVHDAVTTDSGRWTQITIDVPADDEPAPVVTAAPTPTKHDVRALIADGRIERTDECSACGHRLTDRVTCYATDCGVYCSSHCAHAHARDLADLARDAAPVTVAPAAADEPTQEIFIAIGPNVWGKGFTQAQALDAAISGNRAARQHHVIFACTDPWAYVDGMGSLVRAIDSTYREVARREPKRGKGVR